MVETDLYLIAGFELNVLRHGARGLEHFAIYIEPEATFRLDLTRVGDFDGMGKYHVIVRQRLSEPVGDGPASLGPAGEYRFEEFRPAVGNNDVAGGKLRVDASGNAGKNDPRDPEVIDRRLRRHR